MKNSINILLKVFVSVGFIFGLTSCHSKFLSIQNQICRDGAVWNSTKTELAFVAIQSATRAPVGIAKFPDGGRRETEYSNLVLFTYNIKTNKLKKLTDFKKLCYTTARDNYNFELVFSDSIIYYHIDLYWKSITDSVAREKYRDKYFAIDVNTNKISEIRDSLFSYECKTHKQANILSSDILKNIPCSKWGMVLNDIYPQSKKDYMDYIIKGNLDKLTSDCIFDQIVPSFNKDDIDFILKKMEKHKAKLYKEYNSYKDNDPYRKSLKLDEYHGYKNYITKTKSRFEKAHKL